MLSFNDSHSSRRAFLQIGSLALGGLTLPQLLAVKAHAAEQKRPVKDKSVIFLFLHGGPSQFETFDPKMDAPAEIRSTTGEIPTKIPGITFGSTFARLAALNHKFSIVRSFRTGDGNHDIKPVVGKATMGANLGSLYARVAGTNDPVSGMPLNCALFPRAVNAETGAMVDQFGKFDSVGTLGSAYAPFIPGGGGSFQKNLKLAIARDRVDDRRNLLAGLDSLKRGLDQGTIDGVDKFQQQALTTILGGVAEAFAISKEDPKTIARYDTEPLVRPDQISRTWNNYPRYVDNAKTLGKLLLLARRLCEAGCGFVTVTTNFVWDMHADINNAGCEEGMGYMGVPLDHALSAFIEDTQARGLDKKILLVACGEMGRTPRLNKNGGRDHWGGLAPLLLYGGGLQMGQVIGQSSRDGGEPRSEPISIENLVATIAGELLDLGQVRLMSSLPNELVRTLTNGAPIPGLG